MKTEDEFRNDAIKEDHMCQFEMFPPNEDHIEIYGGSGVGHTRYI